MIKNIEQAKEHVSRNICQCCKDLQSRANAILHDLSPKSILKMSK